MVIAFCGLKTCGKTTAAEYLVNENGFERMSFAGPLKEAAKLMFNLTDEQVYGSEKEVVDYRWNLTPRQILQQLGTEVGRQFDNEIWVKNMQSRLRNAERVVIDDCRFLNESQAIRDAGGMVVGIQRPGLSVDNHPSELEMAENWNTMIDAEINNSGSLYELYAMIEGLLTSGE